MLSCRRKSDDVEDGIPGRVMGDTAPRLGDGAGVVGGGWWTPIVDTIWQPGNTKHFKDSF